MNVILRNISAPILGWILGSVVNMGIIMLSPLVLTYPEGFDNSTMERLAETIHLLSTGLLLMPFFAHALGALFGAFVAAKTAASHQMKFALGVGAFFLIGGILMVNMVPSPTWFNALDLIVAYIPMAFIGGKLAGAK